MFIRRRAVKLLLFFTFPAFLFTISLSGCGDKADPVRSPDGSDGSQSDSITYTLGIKEILDQHCIRCHSHIKTGAERNGAPPEVNFDTYESAVKSAQRANARIQAGTMPPDGGIAEEQHALFQKWIGKGTPQ